MSLYFIILVLLYGLVSKYLATKANDHLKPEYKKKSLGIFAPRLYWSKDKYIDKEGIKYKNKLLVLFISMIPLTVLPGIFLPHLVGESIQNQVYSYKTATNTSVIELKKMTDFEWDRVYIFDRGVTKREAENILRFIPKSSWREQMFVFTNKGKYVSSEELYFRTRDRDIRIMLDSGKTYLSFPPDSAKFMLSQNYLTDVYSLEPIYK